MRSAPANWLLLGTGLAISLAMLVLSWNLPLLESFPYRQTQTAMSVYWLASSSSWLAYQTPMFGYPWAIPFEFPLYQIIVHGVASVLPISLDQGGRLVSWLFALATLFPLRACVKEITGRDALANDLLLFFLLSPLYLFGTRSFLIESTALFFSVLFMAAVVRFWRTPVWPWFALMLASACAAALVKITTFFPFGVLALLFVVWKSPRPVIRMLPIAVSVVAAILATAAYIHFADLQKLATVNGVALTSQALSGWNYGTWAQRASGHLWLDVVLGRVPHDLLGSALVLPVAVVLLALFGRGLRGFAVCLAVGYVLPFLVFANLHEVHRYYQQANGVFMLTIVACAVDGVRSRFNEAAALATTILVVVVMLVGFGRDYLPFITAPHINQRTVALATFARQQTAPDDVVLIFSDDLSPEVAYYATRRAMIVNAKIRAAVLDRMRAQPASYLGPYPLGLVIVCPNKMATTPALAIAFPKLFDSVTAKRARVGIAGCDVYR